MIDLVTYEFKDLNTGKIRPKIFYEFIRREDI